MDLNLILSSKLLPLEKISPSRFIELEECSLRVSLAASGIPHLIPNSPAARLGTIIHKMFDLASKGVINTEIDFDKEWIKLLAKVENIMASNSLEKYFVPLNLNVRYFDVKKDLCLLGVQKILGLKKSNFYSQGLAQSQRSPNFTGSELYFETSDQKVNGVVDDIRQGKDGIEIIDYKSGVIIEETSTGTEIKNSYQIQLKIYAALYYFNKGFWPSKLTLLGINQQDFTVPFTPEECLSLIAKAKQKLEEVNNSIISARPWEELASPSARACKFCQYRPVCKKYLTLVKGESEYPIDIVGKILEKREFKNGYRLVLQCDSEDIVVRALDTERHSVLKEQVESIMLFNLRPDTSSKHFINGKFTVSYTLPNSFA